MRNITLKESSFEEVPLGMLCSYPVNKLKLSQQTQLQK